MKHFCQARLVASGMSWGQTRFKPTIFTYCAHLGSAQEFLPQFEASLGTYKTTPNRLVFVTDGGVWIQQHLERTYPQSTHILDCTGDPVLPCGGTLG